MQANGWAANCASFLRKITFFIPSFAKWGLITKILATIIIAGFCADLFYAKINPALPLLKGALSFSPVKYAQGLVDDGKLKTAEEYINFYGSIPGVTLSQEMADLGKKIHAQRTGIVSGTIHQAKHAVKGVMGAESDEMIAGAASVVSDELGVGDFRDLYTEWHNYSTGKDVDKLSAGLAGMGVVLTLGDLAGKIGGVFTGGTTAAAAQAIITPVKRACLAIKKSIKFMNPKLRKACQALFEPIFKKIQSTKILKDFPIKSLPDGSIKEKIAALKNVAHVDQIRAFLKTKIDDIMAVAKLGKDKMSDLGDIAKLARQDPRAAKLVAANAGNVKSMSRLSKMALGLGDEGRGIFRFGGKNALTAAEALSKQGKLSAKTLKQSMRVGPNGLKAVAKGCWNGLNKMIELANKYKALAWWFTCQWILAKIPMALVLLMELFLILILVKTWAGSLGKIVKTEA